MLRFIWQAVERQPARLHHGWRKSQTASSRNPHSGSQDPGIAGVRPNISCDDRTTEQPTTRRRTRQHHLRQKISCAPVQRHTILVASLFSQLDLFLKRRVPRARNVILGCFQEVTEPLQSLGRQSDLAHREHERLRTIWGQRHDRGT